MTHGHRWPSMAIDPKPSRASPEAQARGGQVRGHAHRAEGHRGAAAPQRHCGAPRDGRGRVHEGDNTFHDYGLPAWEGMGVEPILLRSLGSEGNHMQTKWQLGITNTAWYGQTCTSPGQLVSQQISATTEKCRRQSGRRRGLERRGSRELWTRKGAS